MNKQRSAGTILIAGFILIIVASLAGPPGLFEEPDLSARLDVIARNL